MPGPDAKRAVVSAAGSTGLGRTGLVEATICRDICVCVGRLVRSSHSPGGPDAPVTDAVARMM